MRDPAIEVVDLHRSFDGERVLRGVDLRVPKGATLVLLGISGSGKTVLLKHVLGLLQAERGQVFVDGEDVGTLHGRALEAMRRKVGTLFQSDALFDSLSVFDNVAFGLREQLHLPKGEVRTRVQRILREVGLQDVAQQLPGTLSGGMRKRVAFARAAVTEPDILLYDEPTAGLDPPNSQSVIEIISQARARGTTLLAVISDVAAALQVADLLALLHEGRIVQTAPPEGFVRSAHPAVRAFLHDWLEAHPDGEVPQHP